PEGLFADFHFNPKHCLAEQLIWDAEHAPENVGFSHNVQARTSRRGETTLVEEILHVHGVDLVADPATTRGLFESADPPITQRADLVEDAEPLTACAESCSQEKTDEVARLPVELDGLGAKQAADQRRATIASLLAEYHLPPLDADDPAA